MKAKAKQIKAAIQRPCTSSRAVHFAFKAGPAWGRKKERSKGMSTGSRERNAKRSNAVTLVRVPLARSISCPTAIARIDVFGCSPVVKSPMRNVLKR
jgi:hypothetical protein